jgi:hydrogenase-4 membrane subunit HyfE
MAEERMMINDLFIQILSGLIIAAIVGFASFTFILYKCIHKQAHKINRINKAFAVVLKLMVIDTRKNHPDSEYITEIDKIYQEIVKDSD